jgi:predicted transcriptional regulator
MVSKLISYKPKVFNYNQNVRYDNKYLLSFSQSSLEWAKELFEHYWKESTPVEDI